MMRGLSSPSKMLRIPQARAFGGAASIETVVHSEQDSQDAPCKCVRTHRAANRRWSLGKLKFLCGACSHLNILTSFLITVSDWFLILV